VAKKRFAIQLDEDFLDGRIAANLNAFKLFLYLLRNAGREPQKIGGLTLERGCILTNKAKLQKEVGLNMQPLRTALQILSKSGELTMLKNGRDAVYCLPNYDRFCGKATRNYQDSNKILTTSATTLLTTSGQPKKPGFNGVSDTCQSGELTTLLTTSATAFQQDSNNFLTVSERENEKENEKEKRTKKEKAKEKDKEKVYIYNTLSLSARTREASGEGEDNTDDISLLKSYGKYGNVRLTQEEHDELCGEFGKDVADGAINILDGHIKKRGAAFKSECHAVDIREWCVSKYKRLQAEKAALEKITPQEYPADYIRMVMRVTGVERALTRPELACVDRWKADGISEDLLTLAYEKTVAKINKPHFVYMDKMLAGWQEKGLSTPGEVDEYFKNPDNRVLSGTVENDRLDFSLDEIFERP
jgi:DNA replication protein DnaD